MPKKKVMDNDFGTICLCAMRYALGRQTYMPGMVQDYIRAHIKDIDTSTIIVMKRDIDDADKITEHKLPNGNTLMIDGLGDTCIDRPGWEQLREFLRATIWVRERGETRAT